MIINVEIIILSSQFIKPAKYEVTTMGWGRTEEGEGEPLSDVHQEVQLKTVDRQECKEAYTSLYLISDDMLCASGEADEENKGSCQGDSGGPYIIKGENATSDIAVAAVSWAIGCARDEFPSVSALFHTSLDFIHEITNCTYAEGDDATTFEDCCSVTCKDGHYSCAIEGSCNCLDFKQDGFDYSSCQSDLSNVCWVSDDVCDLSLNKEECNYDGGDCCDDTCSGAGYCDFRKPLCIDPKSDSKIRFNAVLEFMIGLYEPLTYIFQTLAYNIIYRFRFPILPTLINFILSFFPE